MSTVAFVVIVAGLAGLSGWLLLAEWRRGSDWGPRR